MTKKDYTKPTMNVVVILQQTQLLQNSVNGLGGNTNLQYGGGGHGAAQSRGNDVWGEDDE